MKKYKIDEVCQVVSGGTPSTSEPSFWGEDYVWLTPKDLSTNKNKYINHSALSISELGLKHSSAKIVPIGSILLSSRAPIGYIGIASIPICTNQGFKALICDDKIVTNEYLYYLLSAKIDVLKAISTGSTFLELSTTALKNYEVYLPFIDKQQHIVNLLGSIDDKIENNEKIIEKLEQLILFSYIKLLKNHELFKTCISNISEVSAGKRPREIKLVKNINYNIPVYGASKILGYANQSTHNSSILIIGRVGTLGIVQYTKDSCWISDNALIIKSPYIIFMKEMLKTVNYNSINKGSNQPLITQFDIKNYKIDIPELDVINEFEEYNRKYFNKIARLKDHGVKLNKLKHLYLQKFFN